MILDSALKAVLDACVRDILSGKNSDLNLSMFNSAFCRNDGKKEIVVALAEKVEERSGGSKTIRHADPGLFRRRIKGAYLYLVLCPGDTAEGEVTELCDRMMLVGFGPYENGLDVDAERSSDEDLAQHRAWRAGLDRESRRREAGTQLAASFNRKLTDELRRRVHEHGDAELRERLSQDLRLSSTLTLEKMAYFAAAIGVSIESLVAS